ncbi:21.9 kda heat shock protein [Anaeramoeba ignava]|uniref:21.9 kDa heat shock protein n=1 Tax=Anaeramoeba ignava TaxID=1746090 RepID=A0A9Q0R5D6_ANAIG|nr:21.9 kda heat shock protein [Anaeramoeba ignava]KAJ5066956.1 21.9 kda heat shock protein [Anaeramoeba ignava]KAJ5066962.1 21.9 kda heat shock protein [Anaeramoeba ignava]
MSISKYPSLFSPFWFNPIKEDSFSIFDKDEPLWISNLERKTKSFAQLGIKETEKEIQISGKIHIPKESINIEFDKESRMLSIFGEHEVKKEEKEDEKEKRVRCERSYSSFKQSFKLPELAEIEKSDASFEDGFLSITIPKKEEEKKEEKTKLSINFK